MGHVYRLFPYFNRARDIRRTQESLMIHEDAVNGTDFRLNYVNSLVGLETSFEILNMWKLSHFKGNLTLFWYIF